MKTMQASTSGAIVSVYGDTVVKSGPPGPVRDRVLEQAIFMVQHGSICFPRIKGMTEVGYSMELLDHIEWTEDRIEGGIFREAKDLLEQHVWRQRWHVRLFDALGPSHLDYVAAKAAIYAPRVAIPLAKWYHALASRLVTCVMHTHGDPTVDNMLQRRDGTLVMIDPIPASGHMPALLAVDLGKMLQSARGYEQVKYGYHPLGARLSCEREIFENEHDNDQQLADYFHAVHLLRLIPYQPEHLRPVFINQLEEACDAVRV